MWRRARVSNYCVARVCIVCITCPKPVDAKVVRGHDPMTGGIAASIFINAIGAVRNCPNIVFNTLFYNFSKPLIRA